MSVPTTHRPYPAWPARPKPPRDPILSARGRVGYEKRFGDPVKIAEALRALTEAKLDRHIREAVSGAPPLTPEQRTRLAALLLGGPLE